MDEAFFDEILGYGSGLTDVSPRALRYMAHPFTSSAASEFREYWNETVELLKKLFQTESDIVGMVGSIRLGFESILSSLAEPGESIMILANGYWGRYPAKICDIYGLKPILLEGSSDVPVDPKKVSEKLDEVGDLKAAILMHVETDNGIVNPVGEIGRLLKSKTDALFVVDCATSLGAMEVKTDEWNADVCFSGSHKGLNSPVGLTFVAVNDRAWEISEKIEAKNYYPSLLKWKKEWAEGSPGECLFSFPTTIVHAIRARLDQIFQEGPERVFRKHEVAARAIRQGVMKMGLKPYPDCKRCDGCRSDEKFCSNVVTTVRFPLPDMNKWVEFGKTMRRKYNTYVGTHQFGDCGMGKCIHIGTVAPYQIIPRNVLSLMACLGAALSGMGVRVDLEGGIRAADSVLQELYGGDGSPS